MYCTHCGAENQNTSLHCWKCENPLPSSNSTSTSSTPSAFEQEIAANEGRQSIAQFLRTFQDHVASQENNYNALSIRCAQMQGLEKQRADLEKKLKSPLPLILGIALITLGIALIVGFVTYFQAHVAEAAIIENPTVSDYLESIYAIGFLASPLVLGILLTVIFTVQRVRAPKTRAKYDSQYAAAKSAAQAAADEICSNYEAFPNHRLVAFKYANPWMLSALARIITDGKANTLTQAIQYLENEAYQQEMKDIARANLYVTQEILDRTKSIQYQLSYIGAMGTINAISSLTR